MVDETTLKIESIFESDQDINATSTKGRNGAISLDAKQVDWSVPMAIQSSRKFSATVKISVPWYQLALDLFD